MSILPPNLENRRHDDWPWPFKYIPRKWTSFDWSTPRLWKGNIDYRDWQGVTIFSLFPSSAPKPITSPNTWQISYYPFAPWYWKWAAWYIAYSFPRGKDGLFHQIRLGARWDNVDNYVNWPTFPTGRKYTGDAIQNTKSWE